MDMAQPLLIGSNFGGNSANVSIFSIRAWTHPLSWIPCKSACAHLLIASNPFMTSCVTSLIPHCVIATHAE